MMKSLADKRKDFPILGRKIHNHRLCYLDNAASAQKPIQVIDAMSAMQKENYANVHRAVHDLANQATLFYEQARDKTREFINAGARQEVIFTRGATEGINLVASSFVEPKIKAGDEIILTELEHHSNIVPWHFLRERKGAVLKWLESGKDGSISLEDFSALFSKKTLFVALTHSSNVLGVNLPIAEMIKIAHQHDVPILIDGCQGIVHHRVDVQELDCDFYVFSGHKLYGPNAIGVLYGKEEWLDQMRPFQGGGEMIEEVYRDEVIYGRLPHKFEAGTPPIIEAYGLARAMDYIDAIGLDNICAYEKEIYLLAVEGLRKINQVELFGDYRGEKSPIISFRARDIHPHDLAQLLDRQGVAIRAGHHCAQPLMRRLGVNATARISLALYNDKSDIEQMIDALKYAIDFFAR